MRAGERTFGLHGRPGRRAAARLLGATLLAAVAACDRGEAAPYAGDPEGRVVTAGATADELVSSGATARRIAEVQLTAGLVERWFTAQERLDALAAGDADIRRLLDDRDGAARGRSAIAAATRHLERDDRVRDAIEGAGLSTEEFVLTALALHQALLATSPGAPPELRTLAERNMRFVDQHAGLLERLAAPRQPRVLASTDSVPLDAPFIDTLGGYDAAPDDLSPYPAAAYQITEPAPDTTYRLAPIPPVDPAPLPPVPLAPPGDSVRPPPPRLDSVPATRRDTLASRPPETPRPGPTPTPVPRPVPPTPSPIPPASALPTPPPAG